MGHIGFTGRTAIRKRNAEKHIKNGLCRMCSRKKIEGITICKYHQEYYKNWRKNKKQEDDKKIL